MFEGNLSCCAMKHRLGGRHIACDKTKFVYPLLATYARAYAARDAHPHAKSFYERCNADLARMFPPTYRHANPKGYQTKELFGDKVKELEKFVDELAQDDPLQATLRSWASSARVTYSVELRISSGVGEHEQLRALSEKAQAGEEPKAVDL